jgi:hypothetical protein
MLMPFLVMLALGLLFLFDDPRAGSSSSGWL